MQGSRSASRLPGTLRLSAGGERLLDGNLDESFWSRAGVALDFVQRDPDSGEPATARTAVYRAMLCVRCLAARVRGGYCVSARD